MTNIPELQDWLKAYVTKRNAAVYDSVKKKMADIAYNAWRFTYYSDPSTIRSKLSNLPITKDTKKRTGATNWVGLYKLINWERKNKGLNALGGTSPKGKKIRRVRQTRPQGKYMDGKTKGFLKARAQSARWLRLGWMAALKSLGQSNFRGQNWGGGESATLDRITGKAYGGGSTIKPMGPGNTEFVIYNGVGVFDHRYNPIKQRSESDVARARAIQEEGLNKAVAFVIKDIAKYLTKTCKMVWDGQEIRGEVQ